MAPFSHLIGKYGDDLAVLWVDSHPDMGTGETAYPGYHAMVVAALTGPTATPSCCRSCRRSRPLTGWRWWACTIGRTPASRPSPETGA